MPEDGSGIDVAEERTGDLGEDRVEVVGGLGEGARPDVDFGNGVVGDGGLGDGPKDGIILICGGEALRGDGEPLCHAGREAEVDGEREARRGAEESACDGIEDGGVEEALARAKVVAGYGEIGGGDGGGEGSDGFGLKGMRLGAEEEAG